MGYYPPITGSPSLKSERFRDGSSRGSRPGLCRRFSPFRFPPFRFSPFRFSRARTDAGKPRGKPRKNPRTSSRHAPCLAASRSSQLVCTPTNSPRSSTMGHPECPQYVQHVCLSRPNPRRVGVFATSTTSPTETQNGANPVPQARNPRAPRRGRDRAGYRRRSLGRQHRHRHVAPRAWRSNPRVLSRGGGGSRGRGSRRRRRTRRRGRRRAVITSRTRPTRKEANDGSSFSSRHGVASTSAVRSTTTVSDGLREVVLLGPREVHDVTRVGVGVTVVLGVFVFVLVVVLVVVVFVVVVVVVRGDAVRAREHESFAEVDAASAGNDVDGRATGRSRRARGRREALRRVARGRTTRNRPGRDGESRGRPAGRRPRPWTRGRWRRTRSLVADAKERVGEILAVRRADILPRALETRAGRRELQLAERRGREPTVGRVKKRHAVASARVGGRARHGVGRVRPRGAESFGRAPKRESTTVA